MDAAEDTCGPGRDEVRAVGAPVQAADGALVSRNRMNLFPLALLVTELVPPAPSAGPAPREGVVHRPEATDKPSKLLPADVAKALRVDP